MALQGSQRFAVLLCKFSDTGSVEPESSDFFRGLITQRGRGSLNDYWIAASFGSINLDGSDVFGWASLQQTRQEYLDANPNRADKIQGARAAFPDVNFDNYTSTIVVFNVEVNDGGSAGGVLAGPGDLNVTFLAHETGHILGFDHSFDQSDRRRETWSQPGEYYDMYDIMSAMNVLSNDVQSFPPSGPLMNVANMDWAGWLPANRIWSPPQRNSSGFYSFDLVSLSRPDIPGYVAAQIDGMYLEFRTPEGWDSGIPGAAVLVHTMSGTNSTILTSNRRNWQQDWQPGMEIGPADLDFAINGGKKICIESFDLNAKKARISVQIRAVRPYVVGPGHLIGGVAEGGGGYIILPGGRRIPVQPRGPVTEVLEMVGLAIDAERLLSPEISQQVNRAIASEIASRLQSVGRRFR